MREVNTKTRAEKSLEHCNVISLINFSKGNSWDVHHKVWCKTEIKPSLSISFKKNFYVEKVGEESEGLCVIFSNLHMPWILILTNLESSTSEISRIHFTFHNTTSFSWKGRCVSPCVIQFDPICPTCGMRWHYSSTGLVLFCNLMSFYSVKWNLQTYGSTDNTNFLGGLAGLCSFFRNFYAFRNGNITIMSLIIFYTEILYHAVEHFSFPKTLRFHWASKRDQCYDLSLLVIKTRNYKGLTKEGVCLSFLSYLFKMTWRQHLK